MAKIRKPTSNKIQFQNEVERLQKLVKQIEKSGLLFIESPIPEIPKRVTKHKLEEIKKITLKSLKQEAYKVDNKTGELVKNIVSKRGKIGEKEKVSVSTLKVKSTKEKKKKDDKEKEKKKKKKSPKSKTKSKEKLTPEELHKVRSEAAKKGWETRRKKEEEKTAVDIDKDEKIKDEQVDEIEDKKSDTIEIPKDDENTYNDKVKGVDYGEDNGGEICYENIMSILSQAVNKAVADFCIEYITDTIDSDGERAVLLRLEQATGEAVQLANSVSYESSDENLVKYDAIALLTIISGTTLEVWALSTLEEKVEQDFGWSGKF